MKIKKTNLLFIFSFLTLINLINYFSFSHFQNENKTRIENNIKKVVQKNFNQLQDELDFVTSDFLSKRQKNPSQPIEKTLKDLTDLPVYIMNNQFFKILSINWVAENGYTFNKLGKLDNKGLKITEKVDPLKLEPYVIMNDEIAYIIRNLYINKLYNGSLVIAMKIEKQVISEFSNAWVTNINSSLSNNIIFYDQTLSLKINNSKFIQDYWFTILINLSLVIVFLFTYLHMKKITNIFKEESKVTNSSLIKKLEDTENHLIDLEAKNSLIKDLYKSLLEKHNYYLENVVDNLEKLTKDDIKKRLVDVLEWNLEFLGKEKVDLDELFEMVLKALNSEVVRKKIKISYQHTDVSVRNAKEILKIIIFNLLNYSVSSIPTPIGGFIQISTEQNGPNVKIKIVDSGVDFSFNNRKAGGKNIKNSREQELMFNINFQELTLLASKVGVVIEQSFTSDMKNCFTIAINSESLEYQSKYSDNVIPLFS